MPLSSKSQDIGLSSRESGCESRQGYSSRSTDADSKLCNRVQLIAGALVIVKASLLKRFRISI